MLRLSKIAGMRKLTMLQGGIDQIVAKDIPGDNQGHHIARSGRQKTNSVKSRLIILADAIKFRRRVHGGYASVPSPCGLTLDWRKLDKLSIRQNIGCIIPAVPTAKFKIHVPAGIDYRCGTHPSRKLTGGRLLPITKLVDCEKPAARRGPFEASWVGGLVLCTTMVSMG